MNETTPAHDVTNITAVEFTWDKILTAITLYTITLITIAGNVLVLVAVKIEKKLATSFNYYIVNLAITDMAVAVTAMSLKATHTVLGYWPFGEVVCGLWIFFDYGMTFVSVLTLLLISIDRFWCVTWSVHYRQHHSKRKCVLSIITVWLIMLSLWVPPCVLDRMRHSQHWECFWDPNLNKELVFIVAILVHHVPCCVMMFCYAYIFVIMRKRLNAKCSKYASRKQVDKSTSFATISGTVKSDEDSTSKSSTKEINVVKESRNARDEKVFVTLTYIIVAYVLLWTPFHMIFDISIVEPFLIPELVWEVGFWLTYFNSTVNPFLYAFCNEDFCKTFKRILGIKSVQCNCCKK